MALTMSEADDQGDEYGLRKISRRYVWWDGSPTKAGPPDDLEGDEYIDDQTYESQQ